MRNLLVIILFIFGFISTSSAQEEPEPNPTIQDLDFLIGTWEITFEFYDPRNPESEIKLTETGILTCKYDMEFNGVPKFIVCEGIMDGSNGWKRTFKEYTEYNRLIGSFERIAIYSNWPGMARDTVIFNPETRVLDVRGVLDVQDHITERYQDYYYFNEDYTSFTRRVVSNFSDMPVSEYNLVFNSSAKKIK